MDKLETDFWESLIVRYTIYLLAGLFALMLILLFITLILGVGAILASFFKNGWTLCL